MDTTGQRLARFREEFLPLIGQFDRAKLSEFFHLAEWFILTYCKGYELDGPIYLVLDNSIIQDFKHSRKIDRLVLALSYVALCRFVQIFSDRETRLCISPVSVYEHGGKLVPPNAEAADKLVAEIAELLSSCQLQMATIGFKNGSDLVRILGDVHHDAEFMATLAEQFDDSDLQYDLRAPGGGVFIPMSIAETLLPADMPLRYFDPWYVKLVFSSRIERKIAEQSTQHPEAQPIRSGALSALLAELNELKHGVLKGIGDIDLIQICDIQRQYVTRSGHVLLGQTRDRTLARVLRHRHAYVEQAKVEYGSKKAKMQIERMMQMLTSRPFVEQDARANRIAPRADNFLRQLHEMCWSAYSRLAGD